MHSAGSKYRRPARLAGLGAKMTMLAVIPALILAAVAIGAEHYVGGIGEEAILDIAAKHNTGLALDHDIEDLRSEVQAVEAGLATLLGGHQGALLRGQSSNTKQDLDALSRRSDALAAVAKQKLLTSKKTMLELERRTAEGETQQAFNRYYNFVLRTASNLPRLLTFFDEAHQRTLDLLAGGDVARARANYIFEENARAEALRQTASRLGAVLGGLATQVEERLETEVGATIAHAESSTAVAATATLWVVAIALLAVTVLALAIVRLAVSGPVGKLTATMLRLADGDLNIVVAGNQRRDELGDMAKALQVFKDNAKAAQRLEAEQAALQEKAEADAAERQRRREEALGGEIVALVEKVCKGELSHRLSVSDKSGIFAEVCSQINQLVKSIDDILKEVIERMQGLAGGDLSGRLGTNHEGAFGALSGSVNRMADQLGGIVQQIQTASDEVRNAAAEITSGTEDLSTRTEQAAANLEETAASTEEMAATVKQNASNAENASRQASKADQSAKTGGEVVEQAVGAMAEIETSAKKITDIISVIDEIAFQTNLLALNASVEAARAGEAGKGFAVVAQEVRQLAQRSAKASSDIKALIQNSNSQVKGGVQLVNRAGEALAEIVGSIGEVAGIVQEISNASQEQASGVQEINNSINSMDEMTQQNSALVEESSAAARALSDQAGNLAELMAFFKLEDGGFKLEDGGKSAKASRSSTTRQPAMA